MPLESLYFASEGRLMGRTIFLSSKLLRRVYGPSRGLYVDFTTTGGHATVG